MRRKKCSKCGIVKSVLDFHRNYDKFRSACKECRSREQRNKYASDPEYRERSIYQSLLWYKKNPEKSRKHAKNFYNKNKEKCIYKAKKYYAERQKRWKSLPGNVQLKMMLKKTKEIMKEYEEGDEEGDYGY